MSSRVKTLSPMGISIGLLLLCSCAKPLPEGAYRVAVVETSTSPHYLVRHYTIETTSLRKLALAEQSGRTSHSIAPDDMADERTGTAEATVTVELQGEGEHAEVTVKMTLKTASSTAKCEETLSAPGIKELAEILTESKPAGDITEATTLLRLAFDQTHLEVVID